MCTSKWIHFELAMWTLGMGRSGRADSEGLVYLKLLGRDGGGMGGKEVLIWKQQKGVWILEIPESLCEL